MNCAVLYVRVSTDEQANQVQNLPTQERKCTDRCKRDGLTIDKTFTDAESARTAERPQFQAMLDYCRKHKGKITHVVFTDLSKLARNVGDQSVTLATLRQLGITPVSCDERIEDSAAGKLSVNLLGAVNQFFSDSLSERIKYRMSAGVQQGRWLWVAPIGYLNVKATSGPELRIDPQRADLVRKAFELVASRTYTLEEVLRRINLLGLNTRHGRPLTKQTLSRLLRNQIYAGWIVSGGNKVKGLHQPLVSQALFDDVQDARAGKTSAPVVHKKVNSEFPLKGFVMCSGCGKKLTAGFVKGRKEKYPRYWCWNTTCTVRVSASREEIESAFVGILSMMEPTQELLNRLPEIAKTYWAHRLERITTDRRVLSSRQADAKTLNQKILLQKVNGELSAEDFATLKETVTQQIAEVEAQLNALDAETSTVQGLLEETQRSIVDLVKAWRTGGVQQRQELAFSLYPEGLRYSPETKYFEPHNTLLMSSMHEMIDGLLSGKIVGVPDGI
ncbi:MAG: recombinase family protein [Candidatus Sulfotelmatobacter sp.]